MIHSHKQVNSPGSIWCVWVPPAVLGPVMPRSMCKFRCAAVREVVYHRYSAFPLPFLHPPFLRAPGSSSRESVCEQPGGAEPRQAGWGWLWVLPGVTLSVSPASRRCPHRSPSAAPLLIPPLLLPPHPATVTLFFYVLCYRFPPYSSSEKHDAGRLVFVSHRVRGLVETTPLLQEDGILSAC